LYSSALCLPRADPRGGQRGRFPPLGQKKGKRRERKEGRKKERKIVSLNNFDILNIARRASEGIGI